MGLDRPFFPLFVQCQEPLHRCNALLATARLIGLLLFGDTQSNSGLTLDKLLVSYTIRAACVWLLA